MTTTPAQSDLLAAAEAASGEATKLLVDLLQFPTINRRDTPEALEFYRCEVANCFAYLERWAKERGFTWRNYEDLVCVMELPADPEYAESAKTIGALLHIDVVPAEVDEWTHDPFSGAIESDADGTTCIWGRGAQDDKGPSVAMMIAANLLRESGLPRHNHLKLIIGSTEESTEWECMTRYLEVEPVPDFSIVPDAEFPVINGEKGFIVLYAEGHFKEAADQNGPKLLKIEAGQADNIIPGRCDFSLSLGGRSAEEIEKSIAEAVAGTPGVSVAETQKSDDQIAIRLEGKAAHASLPDKGANSAIAALDVLAAVLGEESPVGKSAAQIAQAARDPNGAGLDIDLDHETLGRTSCALTLLKGEAGRLKATVNVRQPLGITAAEIFAKSQAYFKEAEAAHEGIDYLVDHKRPIRDPLYLAPEQYADEFRALTDAYQTVTGREGGLSSIGGTTFAKAMANAVSFGGIDSAAGEPSLIHQKDERVAVEAHHRNVKIYTLALARLVGGEALA